MRQVIFFISIMSIIFSESGHNHNHSHENEFGVAIGVVPGHDDEGDNLGLHLHYVKGIGEHNRFGIGISVNFSSPVCAPYKVPCDGGLNPRPTCGVTKVPSLPYNSTDPPGPNWATVVPVMVAHPPSPKLKTK